MGLDLIWIAFITGNSSLEPLLEGLLAQIHVNLSWRVFGRNRTGDLRKTRFLKCCALDHWDKVTDKSPKISQDPLSLSLSLSLFSLLARACSLSRSRTLCIPFSLTRACLQVCYNRMPPPPCLIFCRSTCHFFSPPWVRLCFLFSECLSFSLLLFHSLSLFLSLIHVRGSVIEIVSYRIVFQEIRNILKGRQTHASHKKRGHDKWLSNLNSKENKNQGTWLEKIVLQATI